MVQRQNILGNTYDKYNTRNPVASFLMHGFLNSVSSLYHKANPSTVLEVGCGEGELIHYLYLKSKSRVTTIEACDLQLDKVPDERKSQIQFKEASIYDLPYHRDQFDLVVCCEVLEHLEDPLAGLREISRVAAKFVLISTPWEPIWRILNFMRGKYLSDFGNTPGHLQHFTRKQLRELAMNELELVAQRAPFPWTVLLGKPRS